MPNLGHSELCLPAEDWLLRVVRHLDQENLAGVFLAPVPNPQIIQTDSYRIFRAQKRAEQQLLTQGNFFENHRVYGLVRNIAETYRKKSIVAKEIQDMNSKLQNLNTRHLELTAMQNTSIVRAALLMLNILQPVDGEELDDRLFLEDEVPAPNPQEREQMFRNLKAT